MAEAIFTIGLSGSGKSTWAHDQENFYILDSDEIRQEINGNAEDQKNPDVIFRTMYKRGVRALEQGKSVIFCATNLLAKHRIQAIRTIRSHCPETTFTCVLFATPITMCMEQNKQRTRQVPEYVIQRQARQFQCPTENEGWNNIQIEYANYNHDKFSDEIWAIAENFGDQHNPHHTRFLLDHLETAVKIVDLKNLDNVQKANLLFGTALHDIGKPFTQTFDDNHVAHYYGHAEYGAYIALLMGYNFDVVRLINYHMIPTTSATWKKRLGDSLWESLLRLHAADAAAK